MWKRSKDEFTRSNGSVAQRWAGQERFLEKAGQRMPVKTAISHRPPEVFNPFKQLI